MSDVQEAPRIAPEGQIWVCGACGKTTRDLYGDGKSSWDESCMLNASLCYDTPEARQSRRWTAVVSPKGTP